MQFVLFFGGLSFKLNVCLPASKPTTRSSHQHCHLQLPSKSFDKNCIEKFCTQIRPPSSSPGETRRHEGKGKGKGMFEFSMQLQRTHKQKYKRMQDMERRLQQHLVGGQLETASVQRAICFRDAIPNASRVLTVFAAVLCFVCFAGMELPKRIRLQLSSTRPYPIRPDSTELKSTQ